MGSKIVVGFSWQEALFGEVRIWLCLGIIVLTMLVEILLIWKGNRKNPIQKKIKEAERLENYVRGTRVHCTYVSERDGKWNQTLTFTALYKYRVNGIEYTKRLTSIEEEPPFTLTFYWGKNPRKVFSKYDIGTNSFNAILVLIPLVLCLGIMVVLRYIEL